MNLETALYVLAKIHTGWDERIGMTVYAPLMSTFPEFTPAEYVEAWKQVRMHIGQNVNPSPTPPPVEG